VDELDEVPGDATVIFSAHGISPAVRHEAGAPRAARVIDATCPLVTKVHLEAVRLRARELRDRADRPRGSRRGHRYDRRGARAHLRHRRSWSEVAALEVPNPDKIALPDPDHAFGRRHTRCHRSAAPEVPEDRRALSQTTSATRRRTGRPRSSAWPTTSICCSCIGSANSSNAIRLVEVARTAGTDAHLINDVGDIRPEWLENAPRIGITAGRLDPRGARHADRRSGCAAKASRCERYTWSRRTSAFALPQELALMAEERGMTLPGAHGDAPGRSDSIRGPRPPQSVPRRVLRI
jgi:4-hydroxy-3-methylbut-2-enyl diphosphate reductase